LLRHQAVLSQRAHVGSHSLRTGLVGLAVRPFSL
jgi:hypothetical protein